MAELLTVDPQTHARLHQEILTATYPIWHDGLSADAYARWNLVQLRTPWGAKHLKRVALVDGDRWLASAKWYEIDARLEGAWVKVLGIGAVFTPMAERGRGHAAALIQAMLAEAGRLGMAAAVLFSEIGASYYEALGFTAIPRETLTLDVILKGGAPATLVRAGEDADLPHLAELHERTDHSARFAPVRTPTAIQFHAQKRRTQSALAPLGQRVTEFYVSEEGHRAVAYVLISRGPSGNLADGPETMWLEAAGDRDPSGARVGAILQVLLARTPAETPPPFYAWLPDRWLPPQVRIAARTTASDILMVKAIGGHTLPALHGRDITWWKGDSF